MTRFKLAAFVVLGALASACGGPDRPANSPSSTDASDASGIDPVGTRDAGTSTSNPPDTTGTNTGPGTGTDGNAPDGTAPVNGASSGTGTGPGAVGH
jgi:hypothetical protein